MLNMKSINNYIEHTLLKPDATASDIERIVETVNVFEREDEEFLLNYWLILEKTLLI